MLDGERFFDVIKVQLVESQVDTGFRLVLRMTGERMCVNAVACLDCASVVIGSNGVANVCVHFPTWAVGQEVVGR